MKAVDKAAGSNPAPCNSGVAAGIVDPEIFYGFHSLYICCRGIFQFASPGNFERQKC